MNKYITAEEFSDKIREYGYAATRIEYSFKQADNRVWGINVSPGEKNILVFFFKNRVELNDYGFDILSDKRNYFGIRASEVYEAVEQISNTGRYENE